MPSFLRFTTLLSRALACLAGALLVAVELGAQGQESLPRLLGAELGPSPWTRRLSPPGPFDGAASDAARQWTFRPARHGHRDIASRAFLVSSFLGTTP